ncbi:Ssp2 protein [Martiniozyma asiatica (nom. inval.)]|nr:Ssp2 protein [Martiniozyma asiatica]
MAYDMEMLESKCKSQSLKGMNNSEQKKLFRESIFNVQNKDNISNVKKSNSSKYNTFSFKNFARYLLNDNAEEARYKSYNINDKLKFKNKDNKNSFRDILHTNFNFDANQIQKLPSSYDETNNSKEGLLFSKQAYSLKNSKNGTFYPLNNNSQITNQDIKNPIELCSRVLSKKINWKDYHILLFFENEQSALDFYKYSKSQMFQVNGICLNTIPITHKESLNEKEITDKMNKISEGARRVLVFKKPVHNKKHRKPHEKRYWPNPQAHFTKDLNFITIRKDFERYGDLVEVLPVISRKTSFSVQFLNVRTAMRIKHVIQNYTSSHANYFQLNEKEELLDKEIKLKYSRWFVWYGLDPTDKPIFSSNA